MRRATIVGGSLLAIGCLVTLRILLALLGFTHSFDFLGYDFVDGALALLLGLALGSVIAGIVTLVIPQVD